MLTTTDLMCVFVFLAVASLFLLVIFRPSGDSRRVLARLRELPAEEGPPPEKAAGGRAWSALPRVGGLLLPGGPEPLARLRTRLSRAGIQGPQAPRVFLGVKFLALTVLPAAAGLVPLLLGLLTPPWALLAGALAGGVGLVAPGLWLDTLAARRRAALRRALPDALDMLVLCLEGGISLAAALQRVTGELRRAHPTLADEMEVVQRETQLGQAAGDALKRFGDRADLEEVRNLASVILQAERYGGGLVKALRVHADGCRMERQHRAEELAQKAAVKILFPMLLCIFPAIFIVVLGPAAYHLADLFARLK
jgi:tight adherence protein C